MTLCLIPCPTAPIYPPSATRIIFSSTDPIPSFWLKISFGSPLYTSKITAHRPLRDLTLLQVPTRLLELQATNLFNILWECCALSLSDDLVAIVYLSVLRKERRNSFLNSYYARGITDGYSVYIIPCLPSSLLHVLQNEMWVPLPSKASLDVLRIIFLSSLPTIPWAVW